jgi:hypothetical protein
LIEECDLSKDAATKLGVCKQHPGTACHLKVHTVLLKRYGHFGKVPTSLALVLQEAGVQSLPGLRRWALATSSTPAEVARRLLDSLSTVWRVNRKIAAMFLSAVSNPDLAPGLAPWREGVEWTEFVVIDSNVDKFLLAAGWDGPHTYSAREQILKQLAGAIDLREFDGRVHSFNPRLVQQAGYAFMSRANRRAALTDCWHLGRCRECSLPLRRLCPVQCVS